MKKGILYTLGLLALLVLPKNVFAAATYNVYSPATTYGTAVTASTLEEAVTAAQGICLDDVSKTTLATCGTSWTPAIIVIGGEDTTVSSLTTDAVVFVDSIKLTINGTVSVLGAGTIGTGKIFVTGEGKATVTGSKYPSYIGNANTFAFDTTEVGSGVTLASLDSEGNPYTLGGTRTIAALLFGIAGKDGAEGISTFYGITGKVTIRENLGLLNKDKLEINTDAELVVPNGKNLDNRNNLLVKGTLTLDEGSTLYNVGQVNVDGTLTANGDVLNGARNTNGEVVRVGIGEIVTTGTVNVNKSLDNVDGTALRNTGTINVATSATIVNSEAIVLSGDGKLVNNTPEAITVTKLEVGAAEPTELVIPGVEDKPENNPSTGDDMIIPIIVVGLSLIALAGFLIYDKKKQYN